MNQEPQAPLWPEKEIKTIGTREVPGTFGERLKRERELRAITLEEIANSTKIGTRLLHALEDEEFSKLPGGIFNKGFVRAYAKYLGLDEEQAVADYLAAEADQERKRRGPLEPDASRPSQPPQLFAIQGGARPDNVYNIRASAEIVENPPDPAGGFLKAAVILVFLLGIGGFAWKYYSARGADATASTNVSEPSKPAPEPVQTQQAVQTPILDTNQTASASQTSIIPPAAAAERRSTSAATESQLKTPATAADNTVPLAEKASTTAAEFTLDLRADEDSWAQITADGKTLWSGVVSKDASKSFHASKQLVIKLGNAPAVQLAYNGKPLPRFTQDPSGAKTRTLTFTPDGLAPANR